MGLLKSVADAASIRCMRDAKVKVLKSQIAIPFFASGGLLVCVF